MVVLEVGIGGRLDATNIIPEPVVTGVTSLGFDHMEMLGDTLPVSHSTELLGDTDQLPKPVDTCLQKIAREKAGIFKRGRPALTVWQPEDAMEALQVGWPGLDDPRTACLPHPPIPPALLHLYST